MQKKRPRDTGIGGGLAFGAWRGREPAAAGWSFVVCSEEAKFGPDAEVCNDITKNAWGAGISLLFAGLAMAQTCIFQGKVIGDDGNPLKGAVIEINRTDITAHYSCKTDKRGEFFYGGLQIGNYDVIVKVDGLVKDR